MRKRRIVPGTQPLPLTERETLVITIRETAQNCPDPASQAVYTDLADRLERQAILVDRAKEEYAYLQIWQAGTRTIPDYWGQARECACQNDLPKTARCRACGWRACAECRPADAPCPQCHSPYVVTTAGRAA